MKKIILLLISITSIFSQTILLQNRWDLLGAIEDIKNMEVFSSECIDSLWQYKNKKWINYTPNSNYEITSISMGDGFWIKGKKECSIDTKQSLSFTISSNDIENAKLMDTKHGMNWDEYGSENSNISPHLKWSNTPTETKSFAIEMIDLDYQNSLHWAIINIPSSINELPSKVANNYMGMESLINDYGENGYTGPFPPQGETHRYQITIYALSKESVTSLQEAKNNSISQAQITPTFSW